MNFNVFNITHFADNKPDLRNHYRIANAGSYGKRKVPKSEQISREQGTT
jgi:hypothetical protein